MKHQDIYSNYLYKIIDKNPLTYGFDLDDSSCTNQSKLMKWKLIKQLKILLILEMKWF